MAGTIGGAGSAVALRTAFGDVPYFFVSSLGEMKFNYFTGFPGDADGVVVPFQGEQVIYLPVSRFT